MGNPVVLVILLLTVSGLMAIVGFGVMVFGGRYRSSNAAKYLFKGGIVLGILTIVGTVLLFLYGLSSMDW